MSQEELHSRMVFLYVYFAKPQYGERKLPLAIQLLNYEGKEILDLTVTPRMKVSNYRTQDHGLEEKHVIDQIDEADARKQLLKAIKGTVVVGHRVLETLKQCTLRPNKLVGIRDLAGARSLSEYRGDKDQKPLGLPEIHQIVTANRPRRKSEYWDMPSFRAHMIRDLYLLMERHWKDHKIADGVKFNQPKGSHPDKDEDETMDLKLHGEDEFLKEMNRNTRINNFQAPKRKLTLDERIQQILLEDENRFEPPKPDQEMKPPVSTVVPKKRVTKFEPLTRFEELPEDIRTLTAPNQETYQLGKLTYYNEKTGSPLLITVESKPRKKPINVTD